MQWHSDALPGNWIALAAYCTKLRFEAAVLLKNSMNYIGCIVSHRSFVVDTSSGDTDSPQHGQLTADFVDRI